jgi:outer membrane protein OmpA-like peptidoglycan-associated protein
MNAVYRQILFFAILLIFPFGSAWSQDFLSGMSDNYMGINQAALQPAAIADSRFIADINLAGFNTDLYNDALQFKSKWFYHPMGYMRTNSWWTDYSYLGSVNGKDKNMIMSQSLLGPGFMLTIKEKHAIGLTTRTRSIINVDDVSEPLYSFFYNRDPQYMNQWYAEGNVRAVQHVFSDYGLSYATEILNTGPHFLKAGVTVKLLQGLGAAYLQTDNLYYYIDATHGNSTYPRSWNSPKISAGLSGNWNPYSDEGDHVFLDSYQFIAKPSVGLDLGVVYEFRPDYMKFRYDMDGKKGLERKDKNKYLLKVGVSVLDIGRLKYKKEANSFDFIAEFTNNYQKYQPGETGIPDSTYWLEGQQADYRFMDYYLNFVDTIYQRSLSGRGVEKSAGNEEKFSVSLPTAISLQVDVHITDGLYANLTTYTALNQGYSKTSNSHYISNYSITPRYEHKWFSASIPIQYNQYKKVNVGLGLRIACVYFGLNNLFSSVFSDPYSTNAYLGVKIPIFQKKPPSDMDHDGVSDEKDACPAASGLWEFMGCPDTDGDGITDSKDDCPNTAGLKEFNGCPDTDRDGVPDLDDRCPDTPGSKLTYGCPDTDNDGIMDAWDECPAVSGPLLTNGCPDKDGDGVADYKDKCPEIPGLIDMAGCPYQDTDGDGVQDADDRCPYEKGLAENSGCPDTDGDGIVDIDDHCILTPGDSANFGCPLIKAEDAAVLKTAFENLEFETGKAVIRSTSFSSLDELATLLISQPLWKLRITGHTDNVGNDESNMKLSKNRTLAVSKYLQSKGIDSSRLITEWFGETRPIADNKTPQGRQQNRRVEMEVVFD